MSKNKTKYDMVFNSNKNKIVFNIFPDIINEEFIPSKNCKSNNNNNDTLNFIANIFLFIESHIYSLYEYLINYLPSFHRTFYKIQYFFIILLLFTCVYSFEENSNSNISTNFIVSAYFPTSSHLTHIEYDNIINYENKTTTFTQNKKNIKIKNNNYNKDKLIDCENKNINEDIKITPRTNIDYKHSIYEKKINNNNSVNKDDFYLFFIIPIKTLLFSFGSFILLYFFIKITYSSRIRSSLIFNIFSIFFIYKITDSLYKNNYYLSSTFMFILLIYLYKCIVDSIYLLLKFRKKDFEIFSTNLTAINCQQFILKFILLSSGTIISGFLSIYIYKLCLNYIIFYLCLLTLMVFLCNCLEAYSPPYLKPIKNLLMFIVGLLNFIICKIYFSKSYDNSVFDINSKEIYFFENEEEEDNISSLYFVGDLFSLFCFDYLREYIDYHYNDNFKFHKKFTILDFIIISFFLSSFGIGYITTIKNEYISFILGIYISKVSLGYFIKEFNIKISRLINHLVIIFFIIIHFKISIKGDIFLLDFFSFLKINNRILSHLFSFLSLVLFIYFEIKLCSYLYYSREMLNNDKLKELPEEQVNKIIEFTSNISKQKLKNLKIQIIHENDKYKMENILYNLCDICFSHFEICIIFSIINDYEVNFFIKILYFFLIIFFNSIKFLIAKDIQNKAEYLSTFFISFIFTLRILLLSLSGLTIIYCICQFNLLLLIISYSINNNKNKIISLIVTFYLIFNLTKVNSFFLIINLISYILSPIIKEFIIKNKNISNNNKNEKKNEQKKSYLSLLFYLLIFTIFFLQLYGIYNYDKVLNYFNVNIMNVNSQNILAELKKNNNNKKKIPIEYYFINEIYSFLENEN